MFGSKKCYKPSVPFANLCSREADTNRISHDFVLRLVPKEGKWKI